MLPFDKKVSYSVGQAIVDPLGGEIRLNGTGHHIEPRLMSVLTSLVERHGQVVTRRELLDAVWSGDGSGDESLTQAISALRTVLGDSARSPTYIQTIPKTGYRLIAKFSPTESQVDAMKIPAIKTRFGGRHGYQPLIAAIVIMLVMIFGFPLIDVDPNPNPYFNPNPNPEMGIAPESLDVD